MPSPRLESPASPGLAPHPCGEAGLAPNHLHHWQPAEAQRFPVAPYAKRKQTPRVGRTQRSAVASRLVASMLGRTRAPTGSTTTLSSCKLSLITAFIGKITLQPMLMLEAAGRPVNKRNSLSMTYINTRPYQAISQQVLFLHILRCWKSGGGVICSLPHSTPLQQTFETWSFATASPDMLKFLTSSHEQILLVRLCAGCCITLGHSRFLRDRKVRRVGSNLLLPNAPSSCCRSKGTSQVQTPV